MSRSPLRGIDAEVWQRVEGAAATIVAEVRQRIDHPEANLSSADVHRLRVACKQLRALWRMLEPAMGEDTTRSIDQILRDAARTLAGPRQATVLLETLARAERKAKGGKVRRLAGDLRLRLVAALAETGEGGLGVSMAPPLLLAALNAHESAMLRLPSQPTAEALIAGVMLGVERTRQLGRRAQRNDDDPRRWHRCRRWVKYQHYQLALLRVLKGPLRRRHDRLCELGALLGRHQDGYDLVGHLSGDDPGVTLPTAVTAVLFEWRGARDAPQLLVGVERIQQRLLRRIKKRFAVLHDRPGEIEVRLRRALGA